MVGTNRNVTHESRVMSAGHATTDKTIAILDELLAHTIPLRDLYRSARCQTAGIDSHHLRPLFDAHYKEQLRLVDVLVDTIRTSGGANRVLAGTFLRDPQYSYAPRGRLTPNGLLCDLLDAHESVLSAAYTGTNALQIDPPAVSDFAIGQVALTNDLQGGSVRERLIRLRQERTFASSNFSDVGVLR
jgi:starvation-inducible DNA-binding protein